MHKGSITVCPIVELSKHPVSSIESSLSAGSSTKSSSADFATVVGESGVLASEELELGPRTWLRVENVGVTGVDALDVPDEFRECPGVK